MKGQRIRGEALSVFYGLMQGKILALVASPVLVLKTDLYGPSTGLLQ